MNDWILAVVSVFKDRYGFDLSHMKVEFGEHPVYNDGSICKEFPDDECGGSWTRNNVVVLNTDMPSVMRRFQVTESEEAFRARILAHELAHEIYQRQDLFRRRFVQHILGRSYKENFTTRYLKTVKDEWKLPEETFCEYVANDVVKALGYEQEG